MTRADRNRNPAAITVDVAKQAGLTLGVDYIPGDPFPPPSTLVTAKLLGDPVETTIRVIDAIGYYTRSRLPRWTYMAIPVELWNTFSYAQKAIAVKCHYENEGGTEMAGLFASTT